MNRYLPILLSFAFALCLSSFARSDLEVYWQDSNTIIVYGGGETGGGGNETFTNGWGICTNCTAIPPEQLHDFCDQMEWLGINVGTVGADNLRGITNYLYQLLRRINQGYNDMGLDTCPRCKPYDSLGSLGTSAQRLWWCTNEVNDSWAVPPPPDGRNWSCSRWINTLGVAATPSVVCRDALLDSGINVSQAYGGSYATQNAQIRSYISTVNAYYGLAQNTKSLLCETTNTLNSAIRDIGLNRDTLMQISDTIQISVDDLRDQIVVCSNDFTSVPPVETNSLNGCACPEQLLGISNLISRIIVDSNNRFIVATNQAHRILERLDNIDNILFRALYGTAHVQVDFDNGETWQSIYEADYATLYDYQGGSNVLARIELLLWSLTSLNSTNDTSYVDSVADDAYEVSSNAYEDVSYNVDNAKSSLRDTAESVSNVVRRIGHVFATLRNYHFGEMSNSILPSLYVDFGNGLEEEVGIDALLLDEETYSSAVQIAQVARVVFGSVYVIAAVFSLFLYWRVTFLWVALKFYLLWRVIKSFFN